MAALPSVAQLAVQWGQQWDMTWVAERVLFWAAQSAPQPVRLSVAMPVAAASRQYTTDGMGAGLQSPIVAMSAMPIMAVITEGTNIATVVTMTVKGVIDIASRF